MLLQIRLHHLYILVIMKSGVLFSSVLRLEGVGGTYDVCDVLVV